MDHLINNHQSRGLRMWNLSCSLRVYILRFRSCWFSGLVVSTLSTWNYVFEGYICVPAWSLTAVAIKTNLNYVDYTIELFRFLGWATLVRGASCAWNDIADRKLDAKVGAWASYSMLMLM